MAYFTVVFAAGFLLGSARLLLLVPWLDELLAVALELPIMLALSWVACRWLIARFDVPIALSARLTMGGVAFVVLMAAEIALAATLFGRPPSEQLVHYRDWPALLGLAGQVAFAAFPLIQSIGAFPKRA